MSHPILPFIPAVFVPVKDLKRSTEWYADLLGRQIAPQPGQEDHGIYIFNLEGTQIILDSNTWGSPPMIMFGSDDIDASHAFCEEHPHETVTDVFRDEFVSVFHVNSHMICQTNRDLDLPKAKPAHSLLGGMSRIFIHADNLQDTIGWYEAFVGRSTEPDVKFGELPYIRMDRGAHLLIDDNRLSQSPRKFYEQLQLDMRVNPIAIIDTPDLTAALDHVRSKGAVADKGIESRLGVRFFLFHDPDGNALMVCEKVSR
ncbi:VOC family protein [Cohnella silvisoli]|uniref:VOC family protein n=1 Tax=Cohnella silvisoli TaxID=2873699 RepID=A0ABV1KSD2_9BACL|nr:VOC family protein [Cohnella silvisoli]MCD9022578.1 VOC family protein [Cohnella silvisoli]